MANPEIFDAIEHVHRRVRGEHRYSDPAALADAFIGNPTSPLYGEVQRVTFREPTKTHLFPHVHETLRSLLEDGDDIVIWTQGKPRNQLWKVATSGIGALRHELPKEERKRVAVAASEDKIALLPALLEKETKATLLFVDDKPTMLTAAQHVMEAFPHLTAHYILTNHKATQQEDSTPAEHEFPTITDIAQLPAIKEKLQIQDDARWYIDFGNTLVNSESLRHATDTSYAALIEQTSPIIRHDIDLLAGLPGHVAQIEDLVTEVHGKHVVDVTAPDGSELIIKSADTPEKTLREIRGYELLKDTPLATHITFPLAVSEHPAFLVLPKLPGTQMREAIRKGTLDEETALHVLEQLLDTKKQWWTTQEKKDPEESGIVSHQRANWTKNLERIATVIAQMSQTTGIPIEAFGSTPIISGGKKLPPLRDSMLQVHTLLADPPPYTILTHGDAMGGNILVEPDTGKWHLFDPEYAGYNDPAEAYVKAVKYVTTATAQGMERLFVKYDDESIQLDVAMRFSPVASALQTYGLSRVDEFAKALDDPDFPRRINAYLTASYLREIALTLRRNRPEMAWFALLQAQKTAAKNF